MSTRINLKFSKRMPSGRGNSANFLVSFTKTILLFHRNAYEKKDRTLFLSTDKPFVSHISRWMTLLYRWRFAGVVCSSLSHLPACSSVSSFVSVISRSRSVISVPFVSVFFSETRTNNRVARANRIDVRLRKCLVPVANKGKGEWSPSLKENINNTFFCSFFIFLVNTSLFLKEGSTLRFITWRKYHSMILMKI